MSARTDSGRSVAATRRLGVGRTAVVSCDDGAGSGGDGDRGMVPFALIAVVLLLGSVVYANTLALGGPVVVDTAADDALDRAESVGRPAVRAAATAAAREAALHPVTTPANTTVGRALDPDRPFRDALRLRIALASAEALANARTDAGGVTATASLPAVDSPNDVRAAIERVSVAPLANGTAMRVTVRNVTLTATRGGEAVATRKVNYNVAMALPVLAMHDRTVAYETRLNRSPFEGPGLGRALTWRLWSVAQARGTAQYLGAPISNVLASRHVELSTNAASLRAQGTTYGRSDPAGRAAMIRATGRVGAQDLLVPAMDSGPSWTGRVLDAGETATARTDGSPSTEPADDRWGPSGGAAGADDISVGVNATADRAFIAFLDDDSADGFDAAVRGAYRSQATRRVSVIGATRAQRPPPSSPGPNWALLSERDDQRIVVVDRESRRDGSARSVADERRTVAVRHRVTRRWTRSGSIRTTTATWTDRYRVRVTLSVEYAPTTGPERPTAPTYVRGGPLDGPNLADVPAAARAELLPPGAADREARAAIRARTNEAGFGHATADRTIVHGDRPAGLDDWVYRDLIGLRERVRNVSVPVSRSAVAAGEANAARRLATAIRSRRATLVDAPETYDGAADRARVAARAGYVDAVLADLDARAGGSTARNEEYLDRIGEIRGDADDRIDDLARVAAAATAPEPAPAGRWHAGEVTLTPRGTPGYLPVTAVDSEHVGSLAPGESVHPLAARNTNLFAVPTGDAADAVTDAALPEKRTASLPEAGRALVAANRTAAATNTSSSPDGDHDSARATLQRRVTDELRAVDLRALAVLDRRTSLSREDRIAAVRAANRRWSAPGERTAAVVNGSYATAVARAATVRAGPGDGDEIDRDRLALRLRVETADTATNASVDVPEGIRAGTVDETRAARRAALRRAAKRAGSNATERLHKRYGKGKLGPVLAGLPVAPVPGYWYATVNVWDVEVAGAYPRFAVTAPVGGPDGGDGRVRYVRDGRNVTVDVDGDGSAERLGRSERVTFRTWTVVVVVVPAGPSGVGDVDGNADERSAGWPCPSVPNGSGTATATDVPGCPRSGGE
ncbi:DUF7286 family protein [Halobaculum magnesiiphilum]|uniref:Uncharacterized protein n=1 Tax=Halobaculum magnesiiphilum TaxID=1017351 RepID=A0A8T8WCU6_9EURY|nr:hypothetical protein [Halobaculum magnesiiphilum]QZP37616.1 hypothetical protein K6T50_00075 [Halobaculum magnesiiphilum]